MKKFPLILTLLTAAGAGIFIRREAREYHALKEYHAGLAARTEALGISGESVPPASASSSSSNPGEAQDSPDRLVVAECLDFLKSLGHSESAAAESGSEGGEDSGKEDAEMAAFLGKLTRLDAPQWEMFAEGLKTFKGGKDGIPQEAVAMVIMSLAEMRPAAALNFLLSGQPLFEGEMKAEMNRMVISAALGKLAQSDPAAALRWFRDCGASAPDLLTPECRSALLGGAAMHQVGTAFNLIGELGFTDPLKAVTLIVPAAVASDQRAALLPALDKYLETLPDSHRKTEIREKARGELLHSAMADGFEAGSQWADSAGLTAEERESFGRQLTEWVPPGENGQWIGWLGQNLPESQAESKIRKLLRPWVMSDHAAAGEWLKTLPEGPTRNVAVSEFSETVAPYDPAAAGQWAETLPPGPLREATMKAIRVPEPQPPPGSGEAGVNSEEIARPE